MMLRLYVIPLFLMLAGIMTNLTGMQTTNILSILPEHVYCTVLQLLSTKQLIKFREVNKQVQKRAEQVLITDYSKKLTFPGKRNTPVSLIKKVSNIRLNYGNTDTLEQLANTNIAHIKALSVYTLYESIPSDKRYLIDRLFAQLQNLIRLKVVDILGRYCLADTKAILEALPVCSALKELDITTPLQMTIWPTLIRLLSNAPNLEILSIDNSRTSSYDDMLCEPLDTSLMIQCIYCLQALKNLKRFTLYTKAVDRYGWPVKDIRKEWVLALARVLPLLTQLRSIDLSKNALTEESEQLIQNSCAKLSALQKFIVHRYYAGGSISTFGTFT